mmetsp:Transcript_21202/g.42308  ORF Transcript_21202/g.42308 Transcript_21202/m.42308 type:complete len:262 (+) Transcript_21202:1642-2427(+)
MLRDDEVDEAHLLGLGGPDVLAGEHHVHGGLDADEREEVLGASEAGKEAKLDLGQAHLGLAAVGADAVVAPKGPLEASAEGRTVDGADHGHTLGLHVLEEVDAVLDDGKELGLVLHVLDVLDVGTGDEVVALGGNEHDGLDVIPGGYLRIPHGLGCGGHLKGDGVDRLGPVKPNDGDAGGSYLDRLEVLPNVNLSGRGTGRRNGLRTERPGKRQRGAQHSVRSRLHKNRRRRTPDTANQRPGQHIGGSTTEHIDLTSDMRD